MRRLRSLDQYHITAQQPSREVTGSVDVFVVAANLEFGTELDHWDITIECQPTDESCESRNQYQQVLWYCADIFLETIKYG